MERSESPKRKRPRIKKAECAQCGGTRNCRIQGKYAESASDGYVDWNKEWFILQCRGCDYIFCQTVSTDSESYHYGEFDGHQTIEYDETIHYWPAVSKRRRPDWMSDLGLNVGTSERLDAILELYNALNSDLHILAGIGIRTSFDVASEMLSVNADTFKEKLDGLVSGGHIGPLDRTRLEMLVQAGNASAHRGWSPSPSDLQIMMDSLEHFLEEAFVTPARKKKLDEQANTVKQKVPLRGKKKSKQ